MDKMKTVGYEPLVNDIKEMIHKKHYHAMKALNAETILLYWEIGEEIFKQQEENQSSRYCQRSCRRNFLGRRAIPLPTCGG